ncbi:MAG: hypothetical protein WA789_16270 [Candidatus Acidiferrum sp.]
MSAEFQPVPFQLGELQLTLVPNFGPEDLKIAAMFGAAAVYTRKEIFQSVYQAMELLFKCAKENTPGLTRAKIFAEICEAPQDCLVPMSQVLSKLLWLKAASENRGHKCPITN